MESAENSFMGGVPPVTVTASNGAVVNFNFSVRLIVQVRDTESSMRLNENVGEDVANLALVRT